MGRRLLLILALAVVVGSIVRLAPAQDAPDPPPATGMPPPADEAPPAVVAPPERLDDIPVPPARKDEEGMPPLPDGRAGSKAPRKAAQGPAAQGAAGHAMPQGQPRVAPLVPNQPPAPAGTPRGNLVDGPLEPPPGPMDEPASGPGAPARDPAVQQSQAAAPGNVNPETDPLPPAMKHPGDNASSVAASESDGFVLPLDRLQMGRQSAGLAVEVLGPAALNLNTIATYRIVVINGGTSDATDVIVRDQLPEGLEFASSQPAEQRGPDSILYWRLGTIPGGDERTIVVKVKPTKIGQLDHGATVTMRAGAKTRTQVFEPKLKVEQFSTSGQVLKGQPVRFKIYVTNVGNGPARKVKVAAQLSPGLRAESAEADDQNLFELELGDLASGQRIEVDPLGADTVKGGKQSCKVTATSPDVAPGDEAGTNTAFVNVIEPQLAMTLTGPAKRYTDTVATYTIALENPGTATARNVKVVAQLPIGGRLEKTPPRARFNPSTRRISWDPIQLEPNSAEKTQLTFDVRMGGAGVYPVTAEALAELTKRETKMVQTDVKPIADLEIKIIEDRRVVDVGELTTMKITVTNRGSKDAAHLIILGRLSDNLKFTRTAGTGEQARVQTDKLGQPEILFPTIERLAKGETLTLGIEVQAIKVGNAFCRIFANHDDELPHEDYASFRVTAPFAGP